MTRPNYLNLTLALAALSATSGIGSTVHAQRFNLGGMAQQMIRQSANPSPASGGQSSHAFSPRMGLGSFSQTTDWRAVTTGQNQGQTLGQTPNSKKGNKAVSIGLSNGGIGIGVASEKSSTAIAIGQGGVGVGVGSANGSAVAVGVGGGSVGVGVGTSSGSAVAVGVGDGSVGVGAAGANGGAAAVSVATGAGWRPHHAGYYQVCHKPIYVYDNPWCTVVPIRPELDRATTRGLALARRASDEFRLRNYGSALTYVNLAIQELPHNTDLHQLRSLVLFALGDYQPAAASAYTALAAGPGWNWKTLSGFYASTDHYTTQVRALEQAARNDSAAEKHFLLAYHYLMLSHLEAARSQLAQVLQVMPHDKLSQSLLAALPVAKADAVAAVK